MLRYLLAALILLAPAAAPAHVGTWGTDTYCDCVLNRPNDPNDAVNGAATDTDGINAGGGACTAAQDGNGNPTACYANTACRDASGHSHANGTGIPIDTRVRLCEDYESPTLTDDGTGRASFEGDGAPSFGPVYDVSSTHGGYCQNDSDWRGANGYWLCTHGTTGSGTCWEGGEPASPLYGDPCGNTGFQCDCPVAIWTPGDKWNAGTDAGIAVWKDNDTWNTEEASLPSAGPLCPDGSRGACDDFQVGGIRIPPGGSMTIGTSVWHVNNPSWPNTAGDIDHFGYTYITGYSSTIDDPPCDPGSGRCSMLYAPWKHTEWSTGMGGYRDFQPFFLGQSDSGGVSKFPTGGFIIPEAPCSIPAECSSFYSSCSNSTTMSATEGQVNCPSGWTGTLFYWSADSSYDQATNFPWDTQHCIQVELKGIGGSTTAGHLIVKIDGVTYVEIVNMDLSHQNGFTGAVFDGYSNTNTNENDYHSVETVYRYEDNMHVRQGPPPPCPDMFLEENLLESLVLSPDECDEGTGACDDVDILATASEILDDYEVDCNYDGTFNGVATDVDCEDSATCDDDDICDFALPDGTYTVRVRGILGAEEYFIDADFTVNEPAAPQNAPRIRGPFKGVLAWIGGDGSEQALDPWN